MIFIMYPVPSTTLLPPVILEYKLQAFHAKENYHYILYQYGYC